VDLTSFLANGNVKASDPDSCWIWGRSYNGAGYGQAWNKVAGKIENAHRVAWKIANDRHDIGRADFIMHECDNKACVNPGHLTLGDNRTNLIDAIARGLATPGAHSRAKTHCPSGHGYTEDNTYYRANGHRICKSCVSIQDKRKRAAK
jgi:hypothetical protein